MPFCATAASLVSSLATGDSSIALVTRVDARCGVLCLLSPGSPPHYMELERGPDTDGSRFVVRGVNRKINVIEATITQVLVARAGRRERAYFDSFDVESILGTNGGFKFDPNREQAA